MDLPLCAGVQGKSANRRYELCSAGSQNWGQKIHTRVHSSGL